MFTLISFVTPVEVSIVQLTFEFNFGTSLNSAFPILNKGYLNNIAPFPNA